MLRKLLLSSLAVVFSLLIMSTATPVAQASIDSYMEAEEADLVEETPNRPAHVGGSLTDMADALSVRILYGEPEVVEDQSAASGKRVVYRNSAFETFTNYTAILLENPPATTEMAIADALNSAKINVAQPAYAQGLGFASLNPILSTWKTFRNVAYFFFVIIFLVIGFLIMLRQKIGGQTVVTAQQAIPNIIVALLLVTFSYAIAGLLIDLMYVIMFLFIGLFEKDADKFMDRSFIGLGWMMLKGGSATAFEAVQHFAKSTRGGLLSLGIRFFGGSVITVTVAVAIALNVFRLFFELLKTYVSIILAIAFAPIVLMTGAIPGTNPFSGWLKGLIGNLAAFPTVLLLLIIFDELTGNISGGVFEGMGLEQGGFLPPYLFNGAGTGAQSPSGIIAFTVGLGTLMIMPEIVKKVKEKLGAGGGVFEQFAGNLGDSFKRGYEGGELIPGLAFTDTNKFFPERLGGLSGKMVAQKWGTGSEQTRNSDKRGVLQGGLVGLGKKGYGDWQQNRMAPTPKTTEPKTTGSAQHPVTQTSERPEKGKTMKP